MAAATAAATSAATATANVTANGRAPADAADSADTQDSAIARAAARMADRITTLQEQLKTVEEQISHAAAKDKDTLVAKRAEVSAALDLAKEIQGTVGQIQRFEEVSDAHAGGASGGLAAQIVDLRRSMPEVHGTGAAIRTGSADPSGPSGAIGAGTPGAGSNASGAPVGVVSAGTPAATGAPSSKPAPPPSRARKLSAQSPPA